MNSKILQNCIDACGECVVECERCAVACLNEQDVASMARCIALDLDCAAICRTAVEFMSRNSDFAVDICAVCADICQACAMECEQHKVDHCQRCAQVCRSCADACRAMSRSSLTRSSTRRNEMRTHS
jgi:hypothetical protein